MIMLNIGKDKMKDKPILLDLFSGIGGFYKGLSDAGFTFEKHYFSEIDKHAIAVYKYHFKHAIYVGSVESIHRGTMPRPNIITFGSPCQDFSLAGQRKGLEGQRSSLIGQAIRLIAEFRPDFFIWENVKGVFSSNDGTDFWAVIKAFADIGGYRLEWQLLNTAWLLPQSRERIYLIGNLAKAGRSFKELFPFRESDFIPDEGGKKGTRQGENCTAITSNLRKGVHNQGETYIKVGTLRTHKDGQGFREVQSDDCPTIPARARQDGSGQPVIVASRGRGENWEQQLKERTDGNTNTLTGVQKDNMIKVAKPKRTDEAKKIRREIAKEGRDHTPFQGKQFDFVETDTMNAISTAQTPDNLINAYDSIRRLTEIECERLQGFPDNFTEYGDYDGVIKKVVKTQRYKMIGNAVTVNVVKEIGKRLLVNYFTEK